MSERVKFGQGVEVFKLDGVIVIGRWGIVRDSEKVN